MLKGIYKLKANTTPSSGGPGRTAGLSEGHYYNADVPDDAYYAAFKRLRELRAALLPANASIHGGTTVLVGTKKPSITDDRVQNGTTGLQNDIPQSALQVTMLSKDSNNKKELKIALTPDARVVNGEYFEANGYSQRLEAYLTELHAKWGFRGLKGDAASGPVETISATGLVTFSGGNPAGIAIGQFVRFLGARTTTGKRISGTFKLITGADGLFKLAGWSNGLETTTFVKGVLMKNEYVYCPYYWRGIEVETPKACVRKVGSPSDKYVGRRKKR